MMPGCGTDTERFSLTSVCRPHERGYVALFSTRFKRLMNRANELRSRLLRAECKFRPEGILARTR